MPSRSIRGWTAADAALAALTGLLALDGNYWITGSTGEPVIVLPGAKPRCRFAREERLGSESASLVKLQGTFVWHHHERADELFLVVRGRMRVELRDRTIDLAPGELVVIPRGMEHRTAADEEAEVLIFEPAATRNTGNVEHATLTAPNRVRI